MKLESKNQRDRAKRKNKGIRHREKGNEGRLEKKRNKKIKRGLWRDICNPRLTEKKVKRKKEKKDGTKGRRRDI